MSQETHAKETNNNKKSFLCWRKLRPVDFFSYTEKFIVI